MHEAVVENQADPFRAFGDAMKALGDAIAATLAKIASWWHTIVAVLQQIPAVQMWNGQIRPKSHVDRRRLGRYKRQNRFDAWLVYVSKRDA